MKNANILQGDIWLVNFNPTLGDEIQKIRPAVIINSNIVIGLDLKIVAPITSWKIDYDKIWWLYKLNSNKINGLDTDSVVNCFQILSVSNLRFTKKIGNCKSDIEEIVATSQNCLEVI